eukprot:7391832-Prymnesium_polylepis.2
MLPCWRSTASTPRRTRTVSTSSLPPILAARGVVLPTWAAVHTPHSNAHMHPEPATGTATVDTISVPQRRTARSRPRALAARGTESVASCSARTRLATT